MTAPEPVDVLIVGAGLAGLTAARDIGRSGRSVRVLEARDRLGGRSWSTKYEGTDTVVEMGGEFFSLAWQPQLAAELERYGLGTQKGGPQADLYWRLGGSERSGVSPVPFDQITDLERVIHALISSARRLDPDRVYDDQDLDEFDEPFGRYMDRLNLGTETRELVESFIAHSAGANPREVPVLHVIDWISQLGNSVWAQWAVFDETFDGGSKLLVDRLAEDSGADIRLSTAVRKITQTEHKVVVEDGDGGIHEARRIIVAVPVETWPAITFDPPLGPERLAALERGHSVRTKKALVLVENVASPFLIVSSGGIQWVGSRIDLGNQRMVCAVFGGQPELFDPDDMATLEAEIRRSLPEARVVSVQWHDWNTDPASLAVSYRPRLQRALRSPHGRVHFAGSDLATRWPAWLAGAIESGAATAATVLDAEPPQDGQRATSNSDLLSCH